MKRLPSTTALAVVVAVLALAAAAGALGSADLGHGAIDGGDGQPPTGQGGSAQSPAHPNSPSGGDSGCGVVCAIPTARSLLGLLFVPLSGPMLAGVVVLGGLLALAYQRGGAGAADQSRASSTTDALSNPRQGSTTDSAEPPYSGPGDDVVVRAFRRLAAAVDAAETTRTPREVEQAAVRAGHDPDAVATLIEAFEAVRYGDGTVTPERERAAERALDEVDPGESDAPTGGGTGVTTDRDPEVAER